MIRARPGGYVRFLPQMRLFLQSPRKSWLHAWRRALAAAIASAAITAGSGCEPGRPFGFGVKSQEPTATAAAPATANSPTPIATRPPASVGPAGSIDPQSVVLMQVSFDVLRTRVSQGVFSGSGKVWNHLSEDAIPAEAALLLQRNGLRVARGKMDGWPPIKAILDAAGKVETSRSTMRVEGGMPLMLEISQRKPEETLFIYRTATGGAAGATFLECINFLRVEYSVPPAAPDSVAVEVMPEIQEPRSAPPTRIMQNNWLPRPPEQPVRVLRELTFRMVLAPGEFLAIGPAPATREVRHIAGSVLLCEEIDGRKLESMYFITPKVTRIERSATNP